MYALYLVHVCVYRIWCAYVCVYVCVVSDGEDMHWSAFVDPAQRVTSPGVLLRVSLNKSFPQQCQCLAPVLLLCVLCLTVLPLICLQQVAVLRHCATGQSLRVAHSQIFRHCTKLAFSFAVVLNSLLQCLHVSSSTAAWMARVLLRVSVLSMACVLLKRKIQKAQLGVFLRWSSA